MATKTTPGPVLETPAVVVSSPTPKPITVAVAPVDARTTEQRAAAKYPDLALTGTLLNQKFVSEYQYLKLARSTRLSDANWAEILADECVTILAHTPAGKPSVHVALGKIPADSPEDFVSPAAADNAPTAVDGLDVSVPASSSESYDGSGTTNVNGYFRKDGTYVHGYTRRHR